VLLGLLTLAAFALEPTESIDINPDFSRWTTLLDKYRDDYVFTHLCGIDKTRLSISTAEPPASELTALRTPAIVPPSGYDTYKFTLTIHGVRVYICNMSDPTGWTGGDSRSCLFEESKDVYAGGGFIRTPEIPGKAMIGTFQEPTSAVQVQSVGTMPAPDKGDLDWEMTKVLQKFGKAKGKGFVDFTDVSYINRVLTKGGQKPALTSCTHDIEGKTINVVYTGSYWFWGEPA
jgi:hypothetical protein